FLSKSRLHHRRGDSVSIWSRSNAHSGRRLEYQHSGRGIWTAAKHQCDLSPAKWLCCLSWLLRGSYPFLFPQCRGHACSAPVLRRRPRRHQRNSRAHRKLSCEQISYGERGEYVGGKPIEPKRFRLPSGQPRRRSGPPSEVLDSSDTPKAPTE